MGLESKNWSSESLAAAVFLYLRSPPRKTNALIIINGRVSMSACQHVSTDSHSHVRSLAEEGAHTRTRERNEGDVHTRAYGGERARAGGEGEREGGRERERELSAAMVLPRVPERVHTCERRRETRETQPKTERRAVWRVDGRTLHTEHQCLRSARLDNTDFP